MRKFLDLCAEKGAKRIFADQTPVSLHDLALKWLHLPPPEFSEYVQSKPYPPSKSVPPDPKNTAESLPYMVAQAHRIWITLETIRRHSRMLPNSVFLDLGAFPFSLDVALRDEFAYSGKIIGSVNLPLRGDMASALDRYGIEVIELNLDPMVEAASSLAGMPNRLPLASNSVDFVNIAHVIEHLYHPCPMLRDAYRVLKPGGKLLVSTDNAFLLSALINFLHLNEFVYNPPDQTSAMVFHAWRGHNRFYTGKDLEQLLGSVGFRTIECEYYEVLYNFLSYAGSDPITHLPKWRADILTEIPEHRNEVVVVAEK